LLKKGFAIIKQNGRITSDPKTIVKGSEIEIILSGTELKANIKEKKDYDGRDFKL
jgi:exodeoxyribonuclease VII large subunit